MDSLDVDRLAAEVIHREDLDSHSTASEYCQEEPIQSNDGAAVALEMVSEAAAAIRRLEEQSAEAVLRARDLANSIVEQLEATEARAERAETAQRESEAEVQELSEALEKARVDLDIARQQLADKDERLAAAAERVRSTEAAVKDAQRRAAEANVAIERIVEAIRTQLPSQGN
jgi:chromosome segregation ATPase